MKRVKVFINGCFDTFHDGHKYLLNTVLDVFKDCEMLVAINSDRSVKELKGVDRPYDYLLDRSDSIIKYIDSWCCRNMEYPKVKVRPFDTEEELMYIMEKFNPDVIVKGNDREIKDIKGSDRWPVLVVNRIKDSSGNEISTTRLTRNRNEE